MKTTLIKFPLAAALLLSTLNAQLSTAFAQGALTPPGAPAAMMKSLDQIEARTPISSAPITITQPGSYYLTTNLNVTTGHAIIINTNQVTLDLNGFTISSTAVPANGYGISLAVAGGNADLAIFNGHIKGGVTNNAGDFSGPGFESGIDSLPTDYSKNVRVTGVSVSGCSSMGIRLPGRSFGTLVESCTVKTCGNTGIAADLVHHCTVKDCFWAGIEATVVSDCSGDAMISGGVSASAAINCVGTSSGTGAGLSVGPISFYESGGIAIDCVGSSASGHGISARIANSCLVGGGTTNITYKYNMP